MTTLGDLQTRIISEINRDDLADDLLPNLNQAISDAISDYQNERFWFNEYRTTGTFQNGQEYTPLPSEVRAIDMVWIIVGGVRFELRKRSMEDIEGFYTVPQVGQPTDWCPFGTNARLWPTPNQDYSSIWLTISQVMPDLDYTDTTSSNYWTTEGMWLICARAKMFLYLNIIKDTDAYNSSSKDCSDAYSNLKGETNRRLGTGRFVPSW